MSIASVLSDALEHSGISQQELADEAEVTQSYISQICKGKKIPTIPMLIRLCDCLEVPISEFFPAQTPPKVDNLPLTDEEIQLVRFYRSMDERSRAMLSGIISSR